MFGNLLDRPRAFALVLLVLGLSAEGSRVAAQAKGELPRVPPGFQVELAAREPVVPG